MTDLLMKKRSDENPKALRQNGYIPAVLYGPEQNSVAVKVNQKEFQELSKTITRSTRLQLEYKDDEENEVHKVFMKEIQYDHLSDQPIHIDFYEVPEDHEVELEVPITTTGVPEGVESGGIKDQVMETLTVKGIPSNIPSLLDLNVEELQIGDTIHVSDLGLQGVSILSRADKTVLSILAPRKEIETQLVEEPSMEEELLEEEVPEGEEEEVPEEEVPEGEEEEVPEEEVPEGEEEV